MFDGLDDESNEVLSFVEGRSLCVDDHTVEVGEDHVATELLQTIQELEEVLLH